MNISDIYNLAIQMGVEHDPRGKEEVEKTLQMNRQLFDKLADREKVFFDKAALDNPYADSQILYGDHETPVKKLMVGIDMELPELLLADMLNKNGAGIDLILAHHPKGRALAVLDKVMCLQPSAWANAGVRKNVAEALMEGRTEEVAISTGGGNYNRAVDAAKLLDIPFMCIHTPCDNLVNSYLSDLMLDLAPETAGDVIDMLRDIPEYKAAAKDNNPPMLVTGNKKHTAGKIFVDMTGGTGGPQEYYRLLAEAGISTVICMHAGKETIEEAKQCHLNLIIAGHMASDSLGINFFLDALEKKGIEIVPISGMIRISRN